MDPPPFAPHGRFSVLTEALLGLLYTHTHRHIQTLRAQTLHDRDPQGDLCISTMSYMGVGTPVCVCHCLLSVIARVATQQLFACFILLSICSRLGPALAPW